MRKKVIVWIALLSLVYSLSAQHTFDDTQYRIDAILPINFTAHIMYQNSQNFGGLITAEDKNISDNEQITQGFSTENVCTTGRIVGYSALGLGLGSIILGLVVLDSTASVAPFNLGLQDASSLLAVSGLVVLLGGGIPGLAMTTSTCPWWNIQS